MWFDLTETCRDAAAKMTVHSSMVSTSEFSLLQSMCAVELMDPKMDQCYRMSPASIDTEHLMHVQWPEVLTMEMVIKILQILIVYEAALADGASVLESTHQCILLWEGSWDSSPSLNLSERALLVYCKSLNVSLNRLCHGISEADIFEDEDFQPLTNKKTFSDHLLRNEALLLAEMQSVHKELMETSEDGACEQAELARLIKCRIELHGLSANMDAYICHHLTVARRAKQQGIPVNEEEVLTLKLALESSASSAAASLEILLSASSTQMTLSQHSLPGAEDVQFAFSTTLVKMMQNSPIRHVNFGTCMTAARYLRGICLEVLENGALIQEFASLHDAGSLSLDHLLVSLSACSQRRLHIMTRSFLVGALHKFSINMDEYIFQSMRCHGVPMALVQWEPLVHFVKEVMVKVCWNTVKGLTVNRSKLLIKLDGLLASWGMIMTDIHEISLQFLIANQINDDKQIWCQYWTMLNTTLLMDIFMGVTAESNLLSANELDYFFWYWDFICNTRVFAFEKLRALKHSLDVQVYSIAVEEYTKQRDFESLLHLSKPADPLLSTDEVLQRARGHLCKGVFRLLVVANQWKLLEKKANKYSSWQWRFVQRFRAFQSISNPPMLTFDEFLRVLCLGKGQPAAGENDDHDDSDAFEQQIDLSANQRILQDSITCFSNAKKLFAGVKKSEIKFMGEKYHVDLAAPLLKFSVTSSVAAMRINQMVAEKQSVLGLTNLRMSPTENEVTRTNVCRGVGSIISSGQVRECYCSQDLPLTRVSLDLLIDNSMSTQFPFIEIKRK